MKKDNILVYVITIIFTELVGVISGLLTRNMMGDIVTSTLTPPNIVFPIVWTILYALMGISIGNIYLDENSKYKKRSIILYLIQLFLNFMWPIIFFNLKAFKMAFIWLIILWILVLLMILHMYKADRKAAFLQIPYILWLTFALYLNYIAIMLNT